jgi:uncharacterized protein (TIGR00251 family)
MNPDNSRPATPVLDLQLHREGVLLPVRAQPGARSSGVRGVQDGALKVAVTQIAEKGKANKSLAEVLSQALQLRKSQLELISGETSSHKRFLVRGLTVAELRARIQAVLAELP